MKKSGNGSKCVTDVAISKCDSLSHFDQAHATAQIRMWEKADAIAKWHIGKWLGLGKDNLKHGEFTAWLEELQIQPRTAQRHMRLAENYSALQIESMQDIPYMKMLALTEGPDGLEPAELKKMTAAELRAEVEKLVQAREVGQGQLEDLQGDLDAERAENESLKRKVKRLEGMKFDSSKHPITSELARLAFEIEKISEAASKIDRKTESDVGEGIMEHIIVLNTKLGLITRMFSVANRKRA